MNIPLCMYRATIALCLLLPLAAIGAAPRNPTPDEAVVLARDAFRAGDVVKLNKAAALAGNHVLAPWIDYWQTSLRLDAATPEAVNAFLARNAGSLLAENVRREWLKLLGKRGQWELFQAEFPLLVNEDANTTCYSLAARWRQQDDSALAEVRRYWTTPKELPEGCVVLAEALLANGRYTSVEVWNRIRLLVEAGQVGQAKRTAAYLPREEALDARQLDAVNQAPVRYLEKPGNLAARPARELVIFALMRLAKSDPQAAVGYWDAKLREKFSAEDRAYVWGQLGFAGARRLLPESLAWYRDTADAVLSNDQLAWYVRIALRQADWAAVLATTQRMDVLQRNEPAWVYWEGRAQHALGNIPEAHKLFARVADEHHFYGRLAAEELGRAVEIPAKVAVPTKEEVAAAAANPGLKRALALYRLDMRSEATREWLWAIRGTDDRFLLAAADHARKFEIWDRAISTADRTLAQHDFSLRYLAPHRQVFAESARALQLEEPWVLGLVRQESRFITGAKSSVGASGLMQLMPATAKWIAGKIGMNNFSQARVNDIDVNVRLGTAYLKHVLDDQGGSPVLAAAAYNAGPGRARRWRDARPLEGAIYAESIPFDETRDYVKKVMINTVYYAAILGDPMRSLKARMGTIPARQGSDKTLALKDEPEQ
ncbi:MAG: transglycosylase SLT domain-containing protein [Proteobacteria bacterium]|nr:transglycosylase SLT domain-containing protein [Pseudomonadota bacterium]